MFYTSLPELRRIERKNMSLRKETFRDVAQRLHSIMAFRSHYKSDTEVSGTPDKKSEGMQWFNDSGHLRRW